MQTTLAVAFGGALGALARYWISTGIMSLTGGGFPHGTLVVNIAGSLMMGVVFVFVSERVELLTTVRPFLVVGFLGAMTTFSTFSLDAVLLLEQGQYLTALTYIALSILSCVLAVALGMIGTRLLFF